jgi:hypothetical protein
MNLLLITILEIIYVLYTFIFMKTSLYFLHPIEIFTYFEKNNFNFFKHSVQKGVCVNRICPFGKVMIIILCIYLILRYYLYKNNYKLQKINIIILIITFILSFLNMNSFVYLIPYFVIELIVSKYFN